MHKPTLAALAAALAVALPAATAGATAPPVLKLPKSPTVAVATTKGYLVSIAAPHVAGRSWRIAGRLPARLLRQVGEADVGSNVVLVFKAVGRGTGSIALALTRGESTTATRAIRYSIHIS